MNLLKNKDLIFDSINIVNKCINTPKENGEIVKDSLKLFEKVITSSIEQNNKTMFYNDNNFFEKMKNSKYINFINNIKSLNIPIDEYKLPIIVTIGNESSGKSSLIRNILKCDIFPIDRNLCTKCPIKIELYNSINEEYIIIFKKETIKFTDKEKTKLYVAAIMNKIETIIEDELYIKISNEYVINSTFYDLPGIIEYPADLREKSKNIIYNYINQPNTLIICVIPANTTRLTSNQALGMVNDVNKTKDCIIALTMVDLLHSDDIELYTDRLLLNNNEVKNLNINKIIGVISHKNKDINENVWFENNLLKTIDDISIKKKLEKVITLENLLISVNEMFNDFISSHWKIDAIKKTDLKIIELENEYKNFGKENINFDEIIDFIKNKINLLTLFNNYNKPLSIDNNLKLNYHNYYYNEEIKKILKLYEFFKKEIIKEFISRIDNTFLIDNDYKLSRFTNLYNFIKEEYINIINNNFIHIDIWFNKCIENFNYEFSIDEFNKLEINIYVNCKRYIEYELINYIIINNNKLLIENNECKNKRKKINNLILNYKKIKGFFENL